MKVPAELLAPIAHPGRGGRFSSERSRSGHLGTVAGARRLGLAVAGLLLVCTSGAAQDNGAGIATPRWQLAAGQSIPWRLTQQVDAAQQLEAGGEASYQLTLTLDARWDVEQVDDEGAATVRQTIERVRLAVEGPGEQTMTYDSEDQESPRGFAARIAPLAKILKDEPLEAVVLPTGEVSEVTVPEALVQQMQVAPGAKHLANLAGADALRRLMQQMSFVLPEQETLSIGDAWQQASVIDAPEIGALKAEKSFRLVEQRDVEGQQQVVFEPTIRLVAQADEEADPEAETESETETKTEGLQIKLKDQETTGEIVFNRTAGRLESVKISHAFAVVYQIGARTSTQTIEQSIETVWGASKTE